MRGAVPPLSQMPSLRSTWLKHKENFGFLMGCLAGETSRRKWLFWHQWVRKLPSGLLRCVDVGPYVSNLEGIFFLCLQGRCRDAKKSDPGMGKEEWDLTCTNQQETTILVKAVIRVQRTVKTRYLCTKVYGIKSLKTPIFKEIFINTKKKVLWIKIWTEKAKQWVMMFKMGLNNIVVLDW